MAVVDFPPIETGTTVTVWFSSGLELTGRAGYVGPDSIWLYHSGGIHIVDRSAVAAVAAA